MSTTTIQAPYTASQSHATRRLIGPVTGGVYIADGLGRVVIDTLDLADFLARGFLLAFSGGGGSSAATQLFDNRTAAVAAHIPTPTSFIITGGYTTIGDGGGAAYVKVVNTAQFPLYPLPTYPTYSFQSADGAYWQYIPEPDGWNAKVAGVVGDNTTDDSTHLMNALLPFQNSTIIVNGGNLSGRLLLPAAVMRLNTPVIYAGGGGISLDLEGQSAGATSGPAPGCTTLQWHGDGSSYPTMFVSYNANNLNIREVNFDGSSNSGTNLVNCLNFTQDGSLIGGLGGSGSQLLLTNTVSPGLSQTFQTSHALSGGLPGLTVGAAIAVDWGTSNFEIVYVDSVGIPDNTSFTANCTKSHAINAKVAYNAGSNGLNLTNCAFGVPKLTEVTFTGTSAGGSLLDITNISAPLKLGWPVWGIGLETGLIIESQVSGTPLGNGRYTLSKATSASSSFMRAFSPTTGILCGSTIQAAVDVAEFAFRQCSFVAPVIVSTGEAYTGIRMVGGGDTKNYSIDNCQFAFFKYGIAGEVLSGNVRISYPTIEESEIADILSQAAVNLWIDNYEAEGNGQMLLTGGSIGGSVTLLQCSYQSDMPANGFVIDYGGNITVINCAFVNGSNTTLTGYIAPLTATTSTLTVTAISGQLMIGSPITTAAGGFVAGTVVQQFGTGSGNVGTYIVTNNQTVGSIGSQASFTDPRFQVNPKIKCPNISIDTSSPTPANAITSIGNFYQWATAATPVFYSDATTPMDFGDTAVGAKWRLFSMGDFGSGQLPMLSGGLSCSSAAMSIQGGLPSGVSLKSIGEFTEAVTSVVLTPTCIAANPTDLHILSIPARTVITSVILDVTTPFAGGGSTATIKVGDGALREQFLKIADAHSGAATFGLVNSDLGVGMSIDPPGTAGPGTVGSRSNASGLITGFVGGWTGGNHVNITVAGGTGATTGSATLYVTSKKYL